MHQEERLMSLTLKVWRQKSPKDQGHFETYTVEKVSEHASFLEMLDQLNEQLIREKKDPIAFDHDCREGICGSCGFMINGEAHGPLKRTTVCQLHMRHFKDGETLTIEPWRAQPFTVLKDLMVDRTAFDRIIQAGGYISVDTGSAPDGNAIPIAKPKADWAFDNATCIGCGACVASCKNASAMLFLAAKVNHLVSLPQGQVEREQRVMRMVAQHDDEGFGACTSTGACEAACPKGIRLVAIAQLNRELLRAQFCYQEGSKEEGI
ncbi:MAG: succinate dehydrogenase/fumarate reductase iron-sulfur subunit [Bdellovibrionaceae bacterium]|nr:succinate dehydrogenase/fumarate reductase iron-sulfur subunit [Pseudobdellovibrionaceae bacterium]MDW8190262.1 succinate dehydrogenase/fumarate reductase iron-sulfur subunit [Pseudobdellovibrionaceae bacterium]